MENEKQSVLKSISEPALKRLPIYHQYLKDFYLAGGRIISCTKIAEDLSLTSILVRKDIAFTAIQGKPKTGYNVDELISSIEDFLGWKNPNEALLVGAGNLGNALLGYKPFKEYGLSIIAAFDIDENKTDSEVYGIKVFDINKFENIAQRLKIKIGIITVSANSAQSVSDMMIKSGIKAILNFTPVKISVPSDVAVQQVNLASSVAILLKSIE